MPAHAVRVAAAIIKTLPFGVDPSEKTDCTAGRLFFAGKCLGAMV
jgi:hypothetical protein